MSVKREQLENYLNKLLSPHQFDDYCPNGLQIEGRPEIKKICFAVSATKESIDQATKLKACALIVHHGLFWKFHGPKPIVGPFAKRILPLIKNDINLFGYHLPLDANLTCGNAFSIAKILKLSQITHFGDHKGMPTGVKAVFEKPIAASKLKLELEKLLAHPVIHADNGKSKIKSIGIITGGANNDWIQASKLGLDAYLTGEISEHNWHEAKEAGIHFYAGGHHATEKLGIQALMGNTVNLNSHIKIERKF
jgi:dinuclear metal center YbgI/SA1388 family protein